MKTIDLHDEFIQALCTKEPKRAELVNKISDILRIEKESAYRRLAGKVHFSVREMGLLAHSFQISVDSLLHRDPEFQWMPFLLNSPLKIGKMDTLCELFVSNIQRLEELCQKPCESGNVYSSLPVEFFIYYPMLMKFMLFKWGHYFIGTKEFDNFSAWQVPERLSSLKEKVENTCDFSSIFYIWDNAIIWTLLKEIEYFHKIFALTAEEKETLKQELKELLTNLEEFLNGTRLPGVPLFQKMDFYVSAIQIGFTSSYFASEGQHKVTFLTNFSYAKIEDDYESFCRIKAWIKSLRATSVCLTGSGRAERRLFFDGQHKMVDTM